MQHQATLVTTRSKLKAQRHELCQLTQKKMELEHKVLDLEDMLSDEQEHVCVYEVFAFGCRWRKIRQARAEMRHINRN